MLAGFDKSLYPAFVVAQSKLHEMDQLPIHERALDAGVVQELTAHSRVPSPAYSFFVSQVSTSRGSSR